MEFNNKLHEMVKALKDTNEYREFMSLKEEIKKDEKLYNMLKEFKNKQKEHQIKYINGTEMSDSDASYMQNLYSIIIQNENARRLLEDEMKLDLMLANVQKILGDALKEIVDF